MTRTYWTTTALIASECAGGGVADLLRIPPFYPVMIGLGYPPYLATIMGTAKLIAAVIIVVPALPRLKEWAYAGITVNLAGAIASHVAMHQSLSNVVAPGLFLGLALASWLTRPPSRVLGSPARTPIDVISRRA